MQICSDVNRPEGTHLLAAQGAELVVAPRATELATWHRWRPVLTANALTSCCWVASVNRPGPEQGVLIGGPSFAVAPDGEVLLETTEALGLFSFDRGDLPRMRLEYPGYLDVRADLYRAGWDRVDGGRGIVPDTCPDVRNPTSVDPAVPEWRASYTPGRCPPIEGTNHPNWRLVHVRQVRPAVSCRVRSPALRVSLRYCAGSVHR